MSASNDRLVVCGLAGSLRADSYDRALLDAARELAARDMDIRTQAA